MPTLSGYEPFRLTIADYEGLGRAGAFAARQVELIEGVVVVVDAELRPHSRAKNQLMYRLQAKLDQLAAPFEALVEPTLALPPHDMPQPDVLVARATPVTRDYYRLDDAAIVIEVGASTLQGDLGTKCVMYAAHGVPEFGSSMWRRT